MAERVEIARNLTAREVMCRCGCGRGFATVGLLQAWERLRGKHGRAIRVVRGFSCVAHNARVGGKPGSRHLFGMALDLGELRKDGGEWVGDPEYFVSEGMRRLMVWAGFTGIGQGVTETAGGLVYRCHGDVDDRGLGVGKVTLWDYGADGAAENARVVERGSL